MKEKPKYLFREMVWGVVVRRVTEKQPMWVLRVPLFSLHTQPRSPREINAWR